MFWDFEWTFEVMPDLLGGLWVTVQVTVLGYLIALVLGLLIAIVRRVPLVGAVLHAVMEFIRTTPLIIQLVFVFLLAPSFVTGFTVGVVVIGVHYAAYTAEVYRSGIEGVAKGQWEAARALSLPASRTWGAIVLPQAIRKTIPALGNYLIAMFKDTPLLLAISVPELLTEAQQVGSADFRIVEAYTLVGILFLLVSVPSAILIRRLERRYAAV
ncbi:ectoine/hydroxyectoine ABC transporter permease subunit EhuD [Nocardiopsis dassonvillei]|uniref:ectoine/hydroxyectoine ABC transporter permease subunit EhuD n=1 Tax=Nocardiopsis dassonvillei TaxID=2014 RepID=UPI00200FEE84|nr:ectoine/hydroxyectoine ABC transporter permease subunit EhuD [Nocardiopsis dassonvillei]MCK9872755.1 ectoine/hydroxyectoine ABC transporter permease subunit EhuD [Nocardiopsis dassonvillei]